MTASNGIAILPMGPRTTAMEHAAGRLREGVSLAYDAAPGNVEFWLVDVTEGIPPALGIEGDVGLAGPQAHRVVVDTPNGGIGLPGADTVVLLLGHGPLGVAYAVERFRRDVLGIDPLAYWTGIAPRRTNPRLEPMDTLVDPPAFEHRIYFENDADELINWSGRRMQLEWPVWKELIDTLVAMGYSGLEMFDSLGRSEFVYWDHYRAEGRYEIDAALVGRVMEYATAKGLVLAAGMALSSPFRPLAPEHACWSRHAEQWKALWRHYLTDTPLRHATILGCAIGDPLWDGHYRCRCDLCGPRGHVPVQNEYRRELVKIVRELAPHAQITFGTYGLRPGEWALDDASGVVLEYSDHGYGEFGHLPEFPPGAEKAVYLHAGYWLDHTVMNPYVARLGESLRQMRDLGATRWVRVNGQSFKPFLLMIEAAAAAAWDPGFFEQDDFTRWWAIDRFLMAGQAEGPAAAENSAERPADPQAQEDLEKLTVELMEECVQQAEVDEEAERKAAIAVVMKARPVGRQYARFVQALLEANEATRTNDKERGYVKLLIYHVYPLLRKLAGDDVEMDAFHLDKCRDTDSVLRCMKDAGSSVEHAAAVRAATQAACREAGQLAELVGNHSPEVRAFVDDQAVFPARLFDALAEIYEIETELAAADNPPRPRVEALVLAVRALWNLCCEGPSHPKWREWYLPNRQRAFGTPPRPEATLAVLRRWQA